jgi:transposase-like protein
MKPKKKIIVAYSESFKKSKVDQIENGNISVIQMAKMIGMNNTNSIYQWLRKYGKKIQNERIVIETDSDYLRYVSLEKEKLKLEQLLGQQQVRLHYYEELLNEVRSHYGEDPEEKFLKK